MRAAAAQMVEKRTKARRARERVRDFEMIAEGRDICNRWARAQGFADFAAAEQAGHTRSDVVAGNSAGRKMPAGPSGRWRGNAADLGVTATEAKPWDDRERVERELRELGAA